MICPKGFKIEFGKLAHSFALSENEVDRLKRSTYYLLEGYGLINE